MDSTLSRRGFLASGLGAAAGTLLAPRRSAGAASDRFIIVNADDLGLSAEVDRGLLEAHDAGIVTSASLLVDGPDAEAAIQQARQAPQARARHPRLLRRPGQAVHRHAGPRRGPAADRPAARRVHPDWWAARPTTSTRTTTCTASSTWRASSSIAGRRYSVPVRGFSDVVFVGRFYGQPEFGKTDLSKISVEVLVAMLRAVKPGVTEISCHPGYAESAARRDLQPRAGGGAADPDRRAGQEDDQPRKASA